MGNRRFVTIVVASTFGQALWCTAATAQDTGSNGAGAGQPGASNSDSQNSQAQPSGGSASPNTLLFTPYGFSPSAAAAQQSNWDPDKGLPSSSREAGQDRFDMPGAGSTPTVRGSPGGSFLLTGQTSGAPMYHYVKRGDTLWDMCDRYFSNPWYWPRVWAYNPQIENPHWIYPGDRVRLREGNAEDAQAWQKTSSGFIRRSNTVPAGTVFLRDYGYIEDEKRDVWGELVGSPDDQMLLSEQNEVYVKIAPGHDVNIDQELTLFEGQRKPEAGDINAHIVEIRGTVRVSHWDPNSRMARARIVEALDTIERGVLVGAIGRRFDVVPPVRNTQDVIGNIASALKPRQIVGQNQVVFLNRGSADGLRPGNRLFVLSQGDRWRASLVTASEVASARMSYEIQSAELVPNPNKMGGQEMPDEVVGEIRVLRAHEHTSTCLVTASDFELAPGDRVVAKRGY